MKKKLGLVLATFIFLDRKFKYTCSGRSFDYRMKSPEIPVILPEEDPDNPSARQDMGGPQRR